MLLKFQVLFNSLSMSLPTCASHTSQRSILLMQWMNFWWKKSWPASSTCVCWSRFGPRSAVSAQRGSQAHSCTSQSVSPETCQGSDVCRKCSSLPQPARKTESVFLFSVKRLACLKPTPFIISLPWGLRIRKVTNHAAFSHSKSFLSPPKICQKQR